MHYLNRKMLLIYGLMAAFCLMPTTAISKERVQSKPLMRLFTTSKERKELNQARTRFLLGQDSGQPAEESINSNNLRELKYQGLVMRADGSYKIWINGVDIANDKGSRFQPEVLSDRSVRLTISEDQTVRLYPGQVYRFEDGLIQEAYQAARNFMEDFLEEDDNEGEVVDEVIDEEGDEEVPIEFDEAELTKQITRIRLLEDRIEELEKRRETKSESE